MHSTSVTITKSFWRNRIKQPTNPYWALVFFSLICFAPFINRPVFVDDHAYFDEAIERGKNLSAVYSDEKGGLGWRKGEAPSQANGPVYFYAMGLYTRIVGTAEWKAHLLIFALSIVGLFAFFNLAQRHLTHPLWAALLWLTTPHVWLTANSLLGDALLGPLILIGLVLFTRGWEKNSWPAIVLGSSLLGLVPLVKYTGLIGMVAAAGWVFFENRDWQTKKGFLFLPAIAPLLAWMLLTHSLYDESHFSAVFQASALIPSIYQIYFLFAFLTGTAPILLLPLLLIGLGQWGNRAQLTVVGFFFLLAVPGALLFPSNRWVGIQLGFWAATGGLWIFFILVEQVRARFPSKYLLVWCMLGLTGLLFARGWICARYFVVVTPALLLLNLWLVDRINANFLTPKVKIGVLAVAGMFSFLLAWADLEQARIDKKIARELKQKAPQGGFYPAAVLSGLRFYLDPAAWKPMAAREKLPQDAMVLLPALTLPQQFYPAIPNPELVEQWTFPSGLPFRTFGWGAGFYGSIWGPLPFSITRNPLEVYLLITNRYLAEPKTNRSVIP